MTSTLLQMAALVALGGLWRLLRPAGLSAEETRRVLTSVVYYLFLPALVLEVLWTADIGVGSLQYTLLAVTSISFAIVCTWLFGRLIHFDNPRLGALVLAAAFPNVTYLGLPVLEQVFGPWARSVVIQIDLFAAAPFLFTVGILLAQHYGESPTQKPISPLRYLNAPPFWAAALAVALNLSGLAIPPGVLGVLQKLSAAVVPLMLFSLGLALSLGALRRASLPYVLPAVVIKLGLMPWFGIFLAGYLSIDNDHKAAAALDLAMPSMVLGIVFCDRYRLDSGLYAMIVTVTTALSLVTLPFWFGVVRLNWL